MGKKLINFDTFLVRSSLNDGGFLNAKCSSSGSPVRSFSSLAGAPRPADQVRALLGDHDDGRVRVTGRDLGHHRGVHHPEISHTVHSQLVIDDGHRILDRAHLARTGLVVLGTGVLPDGTLPVFLEGGIEVSSSSLC